MSIFAQAQKDKKKNNKKSQKQKANNYKVHSVVSVKDTLRKNYKSSAFKFKNMNKVRYYHDPKKLATIDKLIKAKKWDKAYPLLYNYVMNFGVDNFSRDTHLIWKLGKMIELLEDIEVAKSLYRLILKHHKGREVKNVELYYDSLSKNTKDYYVPLEYYYELVEFRKLIDTLVPPHGVLLDMGVAINHQGAADYGPSVSINNDFFLFTSKRNQATKMDNSGAERTYNEDIFVSKMLGGDWDYAEEFKALNTEFNEGSAHMSKDGKTVFFSRCNTPYGVGHCDLYEATLTSDSTWKVRNLGPKVNSVSWDSQPSLSHGEDTLFFASDRIGGFGLSDIYYTVRQKNGDWSAAKNLGPTINTRMNELSPYYHPKYDVLYFSSDGHIVNFGSFDIFKSYNFFGRWQEPKNLGPLVNTKGSEYYFTIDPNSEKLYYAMADTTDQEDLNLQSFDLPMEAQPEATAHFRGTLTDEETGDPFQGIVAVIDLDNGIEIAPKFLRPDGSYDFDLIKDNNYMLVITGDDFFRVEQQFYLKGDTTMNIKTIRFKKWKFASVEFERGKADILPEMEVDLSKVALFLADNPKAKIKISGHTDSDGKETDNVRLSQARADAIKKYIVDKGKFDPKRVIAKGYGSSKPIVPEASLEDKKLNRRVEFEILK